MEPRQAEEFLTDGNRAVEFKLIKTQEDLLRTDITFHPDMCHQIFGDKELVYGYKGLRIKIFYSAGWLNIYCGIEYTHKLDDVVPADILNKISSKYELPIIENSEVFQQQLEEENKFKPFGTLLTTYNCPLGESSDEYSTYEIYFCTNDIPGFRIHQQRQQTFLLWFIDAASFVDIDDSAWKFFLVYEKYKRSDNNMGYAFVGLSTVYEYYGYPNLIRPRISQVLVLPPFQSKGIGTKLIRSIYNYYSSKNNILDFTVEDPTEDFQRLRDFVDCSRVLTSSSFTSDKISQERRNELVNEMHNVFKLNKKQARRIYEILRLKSINEHNEEEFRNFRIEIKQRLNQPYLKQAKMLRKCSAAMSEEAIQEQFISDEERKEKLETAFSELVEQYKSVINRLHSSSSDDLM